MPIKCLKLELYFDVFPLIEKFYQILKLIEAALLHFNKTITYSKYEKKNNNVLVNENIKWAAKRLFFHDSTNFQLK